MSLLLPPETCLFFLSVTDEQKTVGVGDIIGGYKVLDIQAKQVLIEKEGEPAIWKRINTFLLN
jgi:hypothetical protein